MALPIPELVPFRVTRQFRGVLQPHNARSVLTGLLAPALGALRCGHDVLEVITTLQENYRKMLEEILAAYKAPIDVGFPISCTGLVHIYRVFEMRVQHTCQSQD